MNWFGNFIQAIPFFILLIGILIFVHEAGHFLFAKLFKVKVHVFSLGFGPKLLGFTKGETLYKISAFPIGGYVKMLGEDPTEEVPPEDNGRAFGDQPKWQRLLIILGGPAMNLIFPLFLYFGVGMTIDALSPPEIGVVVPGSPAHKAGVLPGDRILSIDGNEVFGFQDLSFLLENQHGQETQIEILRDGASFTLPVVPEPTQVRFLLDEMETKGRIGVSHGYPPPLIGIDDPNSPAGRAGLLSFDHITSVDGKPAPRLIDLEKRIVAAAGSAIQLRLKRMKASAKPPFDPFEDQFEATERIIDFEIPGGTQSLKDAGIESSYDFVTYVEPGGAADSIGLKRGDKLISLGGVTYQMGQIYTALAMDPKSNREMVWQRRGERHSHMFKPKFIPAGKKGDLGLAFDRYENGFWGISGTLVFPETVPNSNRIQRAVNLAAAATWYGIRQIGTVMKLLFEQRISFRSLGGFIMIGQLAGQAGKEGPSRFFEIMALISLNLGLLNLFPIPVLDGGQVVFILVEAVTRRPLSILVKERIMLAGVAMVLFLLLFTTWNDIARLVVG